MTIRVDSEIGKLRRVLVHRPDREIDWMVPRMMEQLLFDDILYAKEARAEQPVRVGKHRSLDYATRRRGMDHREWLARTQMCARYVGMDLDGFQGSFRKLWGYVNSVHAAIPHLTDDGCIVLVSGSPARKCRPGMSAISTVGNAVEGFTRAIGVESCSPRSSGVTTRGTSGSLACAWYNSPACVRVSHSWGRFL